VASIGAMRFAKGHGTGNDFVIVPDVDNELELTPGLVAALCDRHFGVGGDGVLRVVRTAALAGSALAGGAPHTTAPADVGLASHAPPPADVGGAAQTPPPADVGGAAQTPPPADAEWFMDYWNADGSVAEMCGNGVRVFARYLIEEGLAQAPEVTVGTRSGTRTVREEQDGQFTVDMGGAVVLGDGSVEAGGRLLTGLAISVGNPHLACMVNEPVGAVDLSAPQVLGPAGLAGGANIEIARLLGEHEIEMRVHERGSGLTLSCGTGAVAAAVAAAATAGEWPAAPATWTVHVPGGTLAVTPSVTASLLTGPAEIVARGELAAGWAARPSPVRLGAP
jgi:diaminopimelate epimerase